MENRLVLVVSGAAILAAALSGCSGDKDKSSSANGTTTNAVAANSSAKIVIDGREQQVQGTVVCAEAGGKFNIAIGSGTQGIAAVLSDGDSPSVTSVGLGNINGIALSYAQGAPGGKASATKDGKKYTISGTATGVDMTNPTQPTEKSFEIDVTCP